MRRAVVLSFGALRILGGPPGGYAGGRATVRYSFIMTPIGTEVRQWVGEEAGVLVCLTPEGRVASTQRLRVFRAAPGALDRLRRWLGLSR